MEPNGTGGILILLLFLPAGRLLAAGKRSQGTGGSVTFQSHACPGPLLRGRLENLKRETGFKSMDRVQCGTTAIESIFADAVDATFVGPSPTINGYIKSRGEKFVIVAAAASGGAGLVVRQDSGIRSEKDFGGKTIATPQLGNTQDIAARVWLADKGYRLLERGGNVSLIPLSNPDQLTMFKKKQIDGAWTVEPWLARLEVEGGGELLLERKSLWPGANT